MSHSTLDDPSYSQGVVLGAFGKLFLSSRRFKAMVVCPDCQAHNSVDSVFCKRCGVKLPNDVVREAQQVIQQNLSQGYILFNEGKTEEALVIANDALFGDPESCSALALKGMCLERDGRIAEALECYEHALTINPDSALDRIKVNQLRNMLASEILVKAKNDPKIDMKRLKASAGLAAVALLCLGSFGYAAYELFSGNKPPEKVAVNTPAEQKIASQVQSFEPPKKEEPKKPGPGIYELQNTAKSQPADTGSGSTPAVKESDPIPGPIGPGNSTRPFNVGPAVLPPANSNAGAVNIQPTTETAKPPTKPDTKDPDPGPVKQPEPEKKDPGVYEINTSRPVTHGGSEDADSKTRLQSLVKTGRNEFQVGRYDKAATAFERALRAGGDPATLHQRIAQCYERLGNSQSAVQHYKQAITAFEARLKSGNGDTGRDSAALDACKQALKVLGG